MPPIQWSSLVSDDAGRIDYIRVGHLISILLALAAGAVLVLIMSGVLDPPGDALMVGVGALVLPITGGQVAGGITDAIAKRAAARAPDPSAAP